MNFQLPKLLYSYNALEPFIDAQTMEIHFTKHHQAYINNLNTALEKYPDFQKLSLEEILKNPQHLPPEIKQTVINNAGGHYNHSLFWTFMHKPGESEPVGALKKVMDDTFTSFTNFKEKFSKAALTQFGSGWAWLVLDKERKLDIVQTGNQNSPISDGKMPFLGIDVWEHAYYLKYQNRRADYIEGWFNVINWDQIDIYYQEALSM